MIGRSYLFRTGVASLSHKDAATALNEDTVLWIASVTKLMTSVAALQCVERNLISLDEDISRVLPELLEPEILIGFDDLGNPILHRANNRVTLR